MDIDDPQKADIVGRVARLRALVDAFAGALPKTPFVPQQDEAECAAACLETITRRYRKRAGLARCRRVVPIHREGASLFDLQRGAESLGFECLGVRVDFDDDFDSLPVPFIVGLDQHFVVVDGRDGNAAILVDPAVGRRRVPLTELTDSTQGVCLLLAPGPAFVAWEDERTDYSRYWRLAREHAPQLALAAGCSLLLLGIGVAGPWLSKLTLDTIIVLPETTALGWAAASYVLVVLVSMLGKLGRKWIMTQLSFSVHRRLAGALYQHLFRSPLSDFSRWTPSDITALFGEVVTLRQFVSGPVLSSLLECLHPIVYLVMLAWIAPQLIPVVFLATAIYASVPRLLGPASQRLDALEVNRVAKLESILMEQISSYRTLKATATEAKFQIWWQERLDAYLLQTQKAERANFPLEAAMDVLPHLVVLSCLAVAAPEIIASHMSVGAMVAGTLLVSQILRPIASIAKHWTELSGVKISVERLTEAFDQPTEMHGRETAIEVAGDVALNDVCFRYGQAERPLLDGLNVVFRQGEITALVGASGAGKTTLVQLLSRLLSPQAGTVTIDGVDVRELPLDSLRRGVGVGLAEDHLIEDSVLENVALGDASPPDQARAERACRQAQIHEFVMSLPCGYATRIAELGKDLSSGEKQRLTLARILYCDPAIMVLDDVTSQLDPASEKGIWEHLVAARAKKTIIVTTHQPTVLAYADRVFALEDGAIIEDQRASAPDAPTIME